MLQLGASEGPVAGPFSRGDLPIRDVCKLILVS